MVLVCRSTRPAEPVTLVEKALAQAQRASASGAPAVSLRDLIQPQSAVSEHTLAMLGKMTNGGVRDGLVRVVRAVSSKSYVPLVTLYAGIAGWRKHLASFPALAPLNLELKEVRGESFFGRCVPVPASRVSDGTRLCACVCVCLHGNQT
jgi:hypothetical protein